MVSCRGTIVRREEAAPGHFLLELDCPGVAKEARPGQFVHIRVAGTYDPLLRRPFSILLRDAHKGHLQILVRTVGRGTELLAQAVAGSDLDVLGPLGNGFPQPRPQERALLVAGGVGVAPLIFLADTLQTAEGGHYVRGLFGARDEDALVCWQEFAGRCEEFLATTEDGSAGVQGVVTDPLAEWLSRGQIDVVYTCGPRPMMAEVARLCAEADTPCWASLEQFMGCGLGACLACVIPMRGEPRFQRVCKDGPVFPAQAVDWEELGSDEQ